MRVALWTLFDGRMSVQDGVLSDGELNDFQVHCFAVPLQPEELSGVKTVVLKGLQEVKPSPPVMRCSLTSAWLDAVPVKRDLRMPSERAHIHAAPLNLGSGP